MTHRLILLGIVLAASPAFGQPKGTPVVVEKIAIDKVWSGHPVGFALMSRDGRQFVAYYDAPKGTEDTGRQQKAKDRLDGK